MSTKDDLVAFPRVYTVHEDYVEEDFYTDILQDIEEFLTYGQLNPGEDNYGDDISASLEDIAKGIGRDIAEVSDALVYPTGELDDRFYLEYGLYSRS